MPQHVAFRLRTTSQLQKGSVWEPQPQSRTLYYKALLKCFIKVLSNPAYCRLRLRSSSAGSLLQGSSSFTVMVHLLPAKRKHRPSPQRTLSLTMSGSPSSPSRGISKCSGKITIFTSSSYSNFSSVMSNPPSTPTGRKTKHCGNGQNQTACKASLPTAYMK